MKDSRTEEIIRRKISEAESGDSTATDTAHLWERMSAPGKLPVKKVHLGYYWAAAAAVLLVIICSTGFLFNEKAVVYNSTSLPKTQHPATLAKIEATKPVQPVVAKIKNKKSKIKTALAKHPHIHHITACDLIGEIEDPAEYGLYATPVIDADCYTTRIEDNLIAY